MILLIDNYDSFVYNLARYFAELGCATQVIRNDAVTVAEVTRMAPQAIVISPGPCTPNEAGISINLIRELGPRIPTLGVCLGHQVLAAALGATSFALPSRFMDARRSCNIAANACLQDFPVRCVPRGIIR